MGEMPSPSREQAAESKDSRKFEAPKTRADQEAQKDAKQMEGGASSDNPSGSASSSAADYQAFLDQIMGGASTATASSTASKQADDNVEIDLPGAFSGDEDLRASTPEEEIENLRRQIHEHAQSLSVDSDEDIERVATKAVQSYAHLPSRKVLRAPMVQTGQNLIKDVLKLEPEDHDEQVEHLLQMIPHKGVKNVLNIVKRLKSAHLEDDFHKALVQYILHGLPAPQLKRNSTLSHELHTALYEVQLGTDNPTEQKQGLQQDKVQSLERLLVTMEQFYASMLSVTTAKLTFTVEVAKPIGRDDVVFYVSLPYDKKELFERQLISVYPDAKMILQKNDYNVFSYGGVHNMSTAKLKNHFSSPLRSYKEFTHDPMNILLGAFSGLSKNEEGAAVQFIIGDEGDKHNKFVQKVITEMKKNKPYGKAIKHATSPVHVAKDDFKRTLKEVLLNPAKKDPAPIDETLLEQLTIKSKSRIVPVNINLVSSSRDPLKSSAILSALEATFNQFENARINTLVFNKKTGKALQEALEAFIFRRFVRKDAVLLNLTELSTIIHLTAAGINTSRELKKSRFKQAGAPVEVTSASSQVAESGRKAVILGKNVYGASEIKVPFLQEDRMRHFYEIGQTGTGKTYLMKSMIIQDMQNGEGVCYIDPHGSDIADVLAAVPPERAEDLIYFDPAYTARPYGLNILEWDEKYPEQKTFVTNELYEIFVKLFGDVPESLGPMFQQYYRNATLLALEGQAAGKATIADIPKVFADRDFRHELLENSKNPIVNQFWVNIAEKAGGDASLENVTPYITAKTDTFLANEIMRPIISQEKSTMDFKQIMDERKILLVNLSKGRIGDLNAQLLGLLIVGKFLQAALARVDDLNTKDLAPFYLYIDEFQNFTTPSIATILSEARKYKLSLNLAHQFIKQLDEKIRDAVFGNVGTKCAFRVSSEDAEFLEKTYAPEFSAKDISSIENYNAYLSLLVDGTPVKPFNIETITYDWKLDYDFADKLRKLSHLKYGRDRAEIEAEIAKKYMPDMSKQNTAPNPFPWM